MFREVFIPSEENNIIQPVTIPREWYGQEVEVIIFPINYKEKNNVESKEDRLLKLCGAWKSEKSAAEIIATIYGSRNSGKTRILEKF